MDIRYPMMLAVLIVLALQYSGLVKRDLVPLAALITALVAVPSAF